MKPILVKPDASDPKVAELLLQAQQAEQKQAQQAAMNRHATLVARKLDIDLEMSGFNATGQIGILISCLASKIVEGGVSHKIIESNLFECVTRTRRFQERQKAAGAGLAVEGDRVPEVKGELNVHSLPPTPTPTPTAD